MVVHLGDGSAAKIPRRWTDADGTTQCVEPGGDSKFSLVGLRELLKLVAALGAPRSPSSDNEWVRSMLRTISNGVSMRKQMWLEFIEQEGLEGFWAGFSRAGAKRSDRALGAVDGADIDRAGDLCEGLMNRSRVEQHTKDSSV